jgi:hypothetical protein
MFPATGKSVVANFGDLAFRLDFTTDGHMTFTGITEPYVGVTETVAYTAVEVRPDVFMVHWQEKDKTTVVHIEDFAKGILYSNISRPDGSFWNLSGSLRFVT